MQASDLNTWQFRFTDPADQARFGKGWHLWDEAAAIRRPARELIELEGEIGFRLARVIDLARARTTVGNLVAIWLSVRAVNPDLAGPFADFDAFVNFTEWELAPVEESEVAAPLDPTHSPDSLPSPTAE